MNILDYVRKNGKVRTASGEEVEITYTSTDPDEKYPIRGFIKFRFGNHSICEWDVNGYPHNLPVTHGLDIHPVIPVTKYHFVSNKKLKNYNDIRDFIREESKDV